jgi:hypothetical protein
MTAGYLEKRRQSIVLQLSTLSIYPQDKLGRRFRRVSNTV